jgi:long-chain acyl-CoA synthetase
MNLVAALLAPGRAHPERPALVGPDSLTHGTLRARTAACARRLAATVAPGERVALVAGNDLAFVVGYLGALRAGAVVVPLNAESPSHELGAQLDAVTPAVVVTSPSAADVARRAVAQSSVSNNVIVLDGTEASTDDAPPVERADDDLAVLLFTAGTAGAPKPAMLTHGSLHANLEQMQSHPGLRMFSEDVVFSALPLFHVYGLNVVLGLTLFAGASLSLVDHFHPAQSLARIRDDEVDVLPVVPAMLSAWLALDEETAPPDSFARVRLAVSGAAELPLDVARAMDARFHVVVHNGYGLTEASPAVTTSAVALESRPESVGPPLPGVEVKLLDSDGSPVLAGDPGEIVVRGPNVFAGYWNDAASTADVLRDGWLHTGDIAVADERGWLTLVDRAKDLIIVSGFNVHPGEVEDALRTHKDVADVAVIGEPHPRTGETVVAFVVPAPGTTPDPIELLRHAGRRLARYKLPTRVEVVDVLPRTLAGKLVRRELPSRANRAPEQTTKPA